MRIAVARREVTGNSSVEINVTDTGKGIRPEDQLKLFQPFTQVDISKTKIREGTGLGLHLSRKLAELLGGQITFQSEYGKGSTFTVALPASDRMAARVLIVEDNPANLELMTYLLRASDIHAHRAGWTGWLAHRQQRVTRFDHMRRAIAEDERLRSGASG